MLNASFDGFLLYGFINLLMAIRLQECLPGVSIVGPNLINFLLPLQLLGHEHIVIVMVRGEGTATRKVVIVHCDTLNSYIILFIYYLSDIVHWVL